MGSLVLVEPPDWRQMHVPVCAWRIDGGVRLGQGARGGIAGVADPVQARLVTLRYQVRSATLILKSSKLNGLGPGLLRGN